jgi:hypothetical protein
MALLLTAARADTGAPVRVERVRLRAAVAPGPLVVVLDDIILEGD